MTEIWGVLKEARLRAERTDDEGLVNGDETANPGISTPDGQYDDLGDQLRAEMGLTERDVPSGPGAAARLAREEGLTGEHGAPGLVDLAVQHHNNASEVRKEYGVSGHAVQSAHVGPTSFLREIDGYSRGQADTVLLPAAVHAALDRHWKDWAVEQRRLGATHVTAEDLHATMVEAIDRTPNLSEAAKNAIAWKLHIELFSEPDEHGHGGLGLKPENIVELPYKNVSAVAPVAAPVGGASTGAALNVMKSQLPAAEALIERGRE
jgi:hypothetical protein